MKSFTTAVVIGSIVATVSACSLASPTYISSQDDPITADGGAPTDPASGNATGSNGSSGGAGADGGAGGTCAGGAFAKVDVSKLTPCGNGKGHCYDATKVPHADMATACADKSEVCVPDTILTSGGGKLKSCTSPVPSPLGNGACIPSPGFFPLLDQKGAAFLKQDVCSAGELCVPCVDPTNGDAPTGFCDAIGVYDASSCTGGGSSSGGQTTPPPPPPPAQQCCITKGHANGVCIGKSVVPPDQQSSVKQDVCTGDNVCVPSAFVSGQPVKCSAGFLGSGVCMDKCFDDMMSIAGDIGLLDGNGCGDTELCIPCSFVSGKGVPGCG